MFVSLELLLADPTSLPHVSPIPLLPSLIFGSRCAALMICCIGCTCVRRREVRLGMVMCCSSAVMCMHMIVCYSACYTYVWGCVCVRAGARVCWLLLGVCVCSCNLVCVC